MQRLLEKTQNRATSDLIRFISTSGRDIYIQEFYELGYDFTLDKTYIFVICSDGTCRFTLNGCFVDSTSLTLIR